MKVMFGGLRMIFSWCNINAWNSHVSTTSILLPRSSNHYSSQNRLTVMKLDGSEIQIDDRLRRKGTKAKIVKRSSMKNLGRKRVSRPTGLQSLKRNYADEINEMCNSGKGYVAVSKILCTIQALSDVDTQELNKCYSGAVRSYTINGRFSDAESLLMDVCTQYITQVDSKLNWPSKNDALYICNQAMGTASKFRHYNTVIRWFHLVDKKSNKNVSKFSFSCAMGAAQKAGNNEKVLELLDRIEREGVIQVDSIMFNCCITAATRLKRWERALSILKSMKERGTNPDVKHYTSAIDAVAKGASIDKAYQIVEALLNEMVKNGIMPNVTTYDSAITACIRSADPNNALRLLRRMQAGGVIPDARIYNNVMKACAARAVDIVSKVKSEAELNEICASIEPQSPNLLTEMVSNGLMPTSYTYSTAITEVGQLRGAEAAVKFLGDAVGGMYGDGGLGAVSIHVFNPVLEILAREAQADQAIALLRHAQSVGLSPNVHSYTMCLMGCTHAGSSKWPLALELLTEIETAESNSIIRDPLEPPVKATSHVYCAAAGSMPSWREASMLLRRMRVNGVVGTPHVYSAILAAIRRSVFWGHDSEESSAEREEVFAQMLKLLLEAPPKEIQISPEPWNVVLRVCATRGDRETALFLLDEMQKRGVPCDAITYNAAACACARSGNAYTDVIGLIDDMRRSGFEPEESTFISLLDACAANGSKESTEISLNILEKEGRQLVTPRAYRSAIKACGSSGYITGIMDLYEKAKKFSFEDKVANVAIMALDRCNRLDLAEKILIELGKSSDASIFSAFLEACVHHREAEKACCFLQKIPSEILKVGHYNAVLHSIAAAKDTSNLSGLALKLFRELELQGLEPSPGTYLGTLRAMKRNGEWQDAFDLVLTMRKRHVNMQIGYYNAAIGACTSII